MSESSKNMNPCAGNGRALIELILNRSSYRGKFRPDSVPREDLRAILEAGLAAPSGCNKQTTSLIAVDDPGLWPSSAPPSTRPWPRPPRR